MKRNLINKGEGGKLLYIIIIFSLIILTLYATFLNILYGIVMFIVMMAIETEIRFLTVDKPDDEIKSDWNEFKVK
ncbi:MAG: hypothetical protein WC877_01180 [Dehalococcoidales bacterium]|jgi:hypothetical protein